MTSAQTVGGARRKMGLAIPSDDTKLTVRLVMKDSRGFHARPAALFVRTAQQYDADITVTNESGVCANGKSIMGLLTLTIGCEEEVVVTAQGSDAAEALVAISHLLDSMSSPQGADAFMRPDFGRAPPAAMAPPATERAYAER